VALLDGAVLLEVSASERLWGGRAALLSRVLRSTKPMDQVLYAFGATSLIAYAGLHTRQVEPGVPDALPLEALAAARSHLPTLARIGCVTWGQVRALPRGGVARRFGAALVEALDRAYGTRPDTYAWLTLPDVFHARLELLDPVDSAPAMLFGARRLLGQLQVWLQLRQRGVLAIELAWRLDARRNTAHQGSLQVRTSEPVQDLSHLQRLLSERLASVSLPAPAHELRLRSLETQPWAGRSTSLLPDEQLPGDSLAHLIERLSARLGPHKVLCLQAHADHRPERMQTWVAASETMQSIATKPGNAWAESPKRSQPPQISTNAHSPWANSLSPTWLLPQPVALPVRADQPYHHGPLTLLAGPQRLESGWWEAGDSALRDYFVARNAQGHLLWLYRQRLSGASGDAPAQWFWQGVFG